jgi:hypothetical protein
MNAGRDVERLIADWLAEEAPGRAPDRVLAATRPLIDRTRQRHHAAVRDLRIPWRPRTMFDRLAVTAVVAVLAVGGITLSAALLTGPDNGAGACPATVSEADAVDTFAGDLPPAQRAWGTGGGSPGVRPGYLAGFADQPPLNDPGTVVMLDPSTGAFCQLIRLATQHPTGVPAASLDWSPSGDALALALAGAEGPDGREDGVVLIWTPDRLIRIWSGEGSPRLEWAPDGRSLVLWASDGSQGPDGEPDSFDTRLVFADGSPDRTFDVFPEGDGLAWSPDGSRWIVSEAVDAELLPDTALSLIDVADGRATPMNLRAGHVRPIGWTDDASAIVATLERGRGVTGTLDVPVADPSAATLLFGPEQSLGSYARQSPDRVRLVGMSGADDRGFGELRLLELRPGAGGPIDLAPGKKVGDAGFAWSPDGLQVVFHALDEGLWTVNADGSGLRQIAAGGIVIVDDPWQPVPVR